MAKRKAMFKRMLEICEREDPAYTVLHQNATFTAKRKDIKWKASPSFAMDFRADNFAGSEAPAMTAPLVAVRGLTVDFDNGAQASRAVDGIDLEIAPGEALGIVGESGSGKTVTWLAALGLLPAKARVGRLGAARRAGTGRRAARHAGTGARQAHRHDLPGPVELPQSGASHRPAARRGARPASRPARARPREAEALRLLDQVGIADAAPAAVRLSASALRRPEPARHDRHGAGRPARPAGRRRADDGARRHHPGADPRAAAATSAATPAWRWC